MQISQLMTSYSQSIIKYDEERYLRQSISEMFDCSNILLNVLHNTDSTVITMATYWIPDLPNIKGSSGHLWRSILLFANGASYA